LSWYDISILDLRRKVRMNNRVMIVDDEPDILFSLKEIFEKRNYDVVTVSNGIECIKEIEKGFKGIILMDLMMPKMDGWDTISEIVKKGYIDNVAIAIITGKGSKDFQKVSILGSYVIDYLAKPLDMNKLISSVERYNKIFSSRNS
jgi:DNA-binding response OmpR family regulator